MADDREVESIARELAERLARKHQDLSAVILTARVWTTRNRFQYRGFVLRVLGRFELPEAFHEQLNAVDYDTDLLEDWR